MRRREARAVEALVDAVAAPRPPLPPVADTDAVASFATWIALAPQPNRALLHAALGTLALARFARRDRAGRLALLWRLGHSPLAEGLRATAAVSYYGDAGVLRALGHGGRDTREGARDGGRRRAAAGGDMTALHADVCVIGSGAGGAVAAAELAEGGLRVVVLEEGPARGLADATGRPRDTLPRLYRDGGQVATIGRPPLMLPLGRGTGGTTFVNSGTCFRTPPAVLARWSGEHGIDPIANAVFERVETAIGVAEVTPELAGRNAATIRRGAERLGWSGGYLRRNAVGCRGSGVCAFGCPTGAKQHVGEVYLPRALEAGATLVTGARAERILVRGGAAAGVEAATADGRLEIRAGAVVVAAGAVHTPLLLARSGLGGGSGALGRHLTVHPATAVWGVLDEHVDMSRGVPQSYYVDEFAADGFVFEGIAGPPDYLALAAPFAGDALRELMLGHRHVAQCGLMVSDHSRGRVASVLGRPLVRYDLGARDTATFHAGLLRLTELMWAAGARRVILPVVRVGELRDGDSAPLRDLALRPRDLKLMGFHPLGTARAHEDPARGVVDARLAVHGVRGVHVADGAAVPGPLGVNPQITIMALATRLAHHLLATEAPACRS